MTQRCARTDTGVVTARRNNGHAATDLVACRDSMRIDWQDATTKKRRFCEKDPQSLGSLGRSNFLIFFNRVCTVKAPMPHVSYTTGAMRMMRMAAGPVDIHFDRIYPGASWRTEM
eukprot:s4627_g3.t1